MWCGHWRDDRDIKNASHDKTATHTQFWLLRPAPASGLYNRTVRERERGRESYGGNNVAVRALLGDIASPLTTASKSLPLNCRRVMMIIITALNNLNISSIIKYFCSR